MRKFTFMLALALGALAVQAQDEAVKCPPANTGPVVQIQERANAPDFSTTFTDGTTANLYTVLGAGNTVVLDFFYTT
jgi:cytochrome oxidase Cu insertion factor (SCO1/SenC/PrrC family)